MGSPNGHVLRWLTWLLLPVLVALAGAAAAQSDEQLPGIIGDDNRMPLESDGWPWTAIGRVNRTNGGFCTGTLVGPRLVLTAAHCLYDRALARFVVPADLHFVAGYSRGNFVAHAFGAALTIAPGFDPAATQTLVTLTQDWALVTLAEPIDIAPVPWLVEEQLTLASGAPGTVLVHAGYSQDREHMLSIDRSCAIRGTTPDGGLLFHSCDATRGDSGSPLLRLSVDGAAVIGLVVAVVQLESGTYGAAVPAASFAGAAAQLLDGAR